MGIAYRTGTEERDGGEGRRRGTEERDGGKVHTGEGRREGTYRRGTEGRYIQEKDGGKVHTGEGRREGTYRRGTEGRYIQERDGGKVHTIHTQHIVWFCLKRTSLVRHSEERNVHIPHTRHMCTLNPEP
jgi:hypothetical protein